MISPKEGRIKLGLNKSQMARAMGCTHPNTWRKWEDGTREPDAGKKRLLSTLLWLHERGLFEEYIEKFS